MAASSDPKYSPLGNEAPNNKCCSPVAIASVCCCLLVLVPVMIGMVAGYSFTKSCYAPFTGTDGLLQAAGLVCKDGQIAPQLSQCDQDFCSYGMGPTYTPENVTGSLNLWAPECVSNELLSTMLEFNRQHGYELVNFSSRPGTDGQETFNLLAWWLPAENPETAPRIVVQHGNNVDFNDNTVQIPAYLLRSLGFSVLIPNLRYHGVKSKEARILWGYDIFLDTLGAWDYAVADPEGKLGGSFPAEKVGLAGFSMGGFLVSTSFGLEKRVPAAWVDAGVFDLKAELAFNVHEAIPVPLLNGLASKLAWWFASALNGADIGLYGPARTLKPTAEQVEQAKDGTARKRPIAVIHGLLDEYVPPMQSELLLKEVNKYEDFYDVRLKMFKAYNCGKEFPFPTHCQMHTWQPDTYREALWEFWSGVFDFANENTTLPQFPQCTEPVCEEAPKASSTEKSDGLENVSPQTNGSISTETQGVGSAKNTAEDGKDQQGEKASDNDTRSDERLLL